MRNGINVLLLLLVPAFGMAQDHFADSLRAALRNAPNDSVRYTINMQMGYYFQELERDSALRYYEDALVLARRHNQKIAEAGVLGVKGYQFASMGRFSEALQYLQDAFTIVDDVKNDDNGWYFSQGGPKPKNNRLYMLSRLQVFYAVLMHATKNNGQEIFYLKESLKNARLVNDAYRMAIAEINLGAAYLELDKVDSALMEENEALKNFRFSRDKKYTGNALIDIGFIYLNKGNPALEKRYLYDGLQWSVKTGNLAYTGLAYFGLTGYYLAKKDKDSSLVCALKTLQFIRLLTRGNKDFNLDDTYANLSLSYRLNNRPDSVIKYQALALKAKDSLYKRRIKDLADFQNLEFRQQLHLRDIEKERLAYESSVRVYAMLAGIGVLILLAGIFYRNNRQKQKANKVLESTLTNLQATQTQLIQSEKMASLGELTAGIAHEIQNPLNFVNNFSEVNKDLLEELKAESIKPKAEQDEQLEIELIDDLIGNSEKIHHHGKRADFIVKGMLEHSRTSTGERQATNINALADEFMRLSYHGLRAKDKVFNAELVTHFDPDLPNVSVIGQDMGRVLLNLFNNAFYAVNQKKKTHNGDYKPEVTVTTLAENGQVIIKVSDNGVGMPEHIKEKIMQPFFTTKPTGEGTGLGLSLSYDIVVKGHGGKISVESKEGEGSEFTLVLPVN